MTSRMRAALLEVMELGHPNLMDAVSHKNDRPCFGEWTLSVSAEGLAQPTSELRNGSRTKGPRSCLADSAQG